MANHAQHRKLPADPALDQAAADVARQLWPHLDSLQLRSREANIRRIRYEMEALIKLGWTPPATAGISVRYVIEALRGRWPAGCAHPNSCARHGACTYVGCEHQHRHIGPEIDAAIAAKTAAMPETSDPLQASKP